MKRIIALLLVLTAILCLCACGSPGTGDPGMEKVSAAVTAVADNDNMQTIPDSYMQNMMQIDPSMYDEVTTGISKVGTCIDEYGVFKTSDPDALADALNAYLEYREEVWMIEYLPEEHPKLQNAEVWTVGSYVMYAILDADTMSAAEIAFKGCFEG